MEVDIEVPGKYDDGKTIPKLQKKSQRGLNMEKNNKIQEKILWNGQSKSPEKENCL